MSKTTTEEQRKKELENQKEEEREEQREIDRKSLQLLALTDAIRERIEDVNHFPFDIKELPKDALLAEAEKEYVARKRDKQLPRDELLAVVYAERGHAEFFKEQPRDELLAEAASESYKQIKKSLDISVGDAQASLYLNRTRQFGIKQFEKLLRNVSQTAESENRHGLDNRNGIIESYRLREDSEKLAKAYLNWQEKYPEKENRPSFSVEGIKFESKSLDYFLDPSTNDKPEDTRKHSLHSLPPMMTFKTRNIEIVSEEASRSAFAVKELSRESFLKNLYENLKFHSDEELTLLGLTRDNVNEMKGGKCEGFHVHHIVPLSKNGTNNIDNLILVSAKSGKNYHSIIHDYINAQMPHGKAEKGDKHTLTFPTFSIPVFIPEWEQELRKEVKKIKEAGANALSNTDKQKLGKKEIADKELDAKRKEARKATRKHFVKVPLQSDKDSLRPESELMTVVIPPLHFKLMAIQRKIDGQKKNDNARTNNTSLPRKYSLKASTRDR